MILYPGTYLWRGKPGHQTQKGNMPQHALILHYISLKACFTHPVSLVACQSIYLYNHCFVFFFTLSAILLYHFVASPLCTTLEFSDRALTLLSPNSLLFRTIAKPPQLPTHHFGRKTRVGSLLTDVATLVTAFPRILSMRPLPAHGHP